MNNKKVTYIIKLSFLIIIFILGVYLILKPKEDNVSSYKENNISITVLTSNKNVIETNKIIGLILVLSSITGFYLLFKSESTHKEEKIKLTIQERKVYNLIKQGYSNKEIASELNVSISTIKTHVNNIYKKTNISSRKELVDYPIHT